MNTTRSICGNPMGGGNRCGLKPDHRVTLSGPNSSACQDEKYCCPRQHIGGWVVACASCNAEDIAALRRDVDALTARVVPIETRAKLWAASVFERLLVQTIVPVRRAESWLVSRLGKL